MKKEIMKKLGVSSLTRSSHVTGALFCLLASLILVLLTKNTLVAIAGFAVAIAGILILFDTFKVYSMTAAITIFLQEMPEGILREFPIKLKKRKWVAIYFGAKKGLRIKEIVTVIFLLALALAVVTSVSLELKKPLITRVWLTVSLENPIITVSLLLASAGLTLSCIASERELSQMKKIHKIKEK